MYSPTAYYLAQCLTAVLLIWFYPIVVAIVSFYFLQLADSTFLAMIYYAFALSFVCYVGCFFGLTFGIFCRDPIMAQQLLNAAITILNFGAGALANTGQGANPIIRFISWISPVRYGSEIVFRRIIAGEPAWFQTRALDYLGYTYGYTTCIQVIIGMTIFVFLVGWAAICFQFRKF